MKQAVLEQWHKRVRFLHHAHLVSARRWQTRHNLIGFAAIVAGMFAGWEVAMQGLEAGLQAYILGSLAILAALGNAAMKFFGVETRMQRHRVAASQYEGLQYEIERLLMKPGGFQAEDQYERISTQMGAIAKSAPLLAKWAHEQAKSQLGRAEQTEVPVRRMFDVRLTEDWRIDNGHVVPIEGTPIRTYDCQSATMRQFTTSKDLILDIPLKMTRDGDDFESLIHAEGIMRGNTAYLKYGFTEADSDITTYGTMVLRFPSAIEAVGYWIAAQVKGAEFILGSVKMTDCSGRQAKARQVGARRQETSRELEAPPQPV